MSRRTTTTAAASSEGTCIKSCLVISAVISALLVCGPLLYYKLFNNNKAHSFWHSKSSSSSCPPCLCDCPPPLSLVKIAPGLVNLSVTDCGSSDPDVKEEMEKQFVDLLAEELKLQESVSEAHSLHMNITLGEAKRAAFQYQREAEKCIASTETCEAARERAVILLRKERKVTSLWERRARQMGWEGE